MYYDLSAAWKNGSQRITQHVTVLRRKFYNYRYLSKDIGKYFKILFVAEFRLLRWKWLIIHKYIFKYTKMTL